MNLYIPTNWNNSCLINLNGKTDLYIFCFKILIGTINCTHESMSIELLNRDVQYQIHSLNCTYFQMVHRLMREQKFKIEQK